MIFAGERAMEPARKQKEFPRFWGTQMQNTEIKIIFMEGDL